MSEGSNLGQSCSGMQKQFFATHLGRIALKTFVGAIAELHERVIVLHDVIFVPQLRSNLLSCSRICQDGYQVNFERQQHNALYSSVMQFNGRMTHTVYEIIEYPIYAEQHSACTASSE